MVYSQQTGTYYGGDQKRRRVEEHELGMYHAMVEGRVPFEMVHDQMLEPEQIDRFKLLILPNTVIAARMRNAISFAPTSNGEGA